MTAKCIFFRLLFLNGKNGKKICHYPKKKPPSMTNNNTRRHGTTYHEGSNSELVPNGEEMLLCSSDWSWCRTPRNWLPHPGREKQMGGGAEERSKKTLQNDRDTQTFCQKQNTNRFTLNSPKKYIWMYMHIYFWRLNDKTVIILFSPYIYISIIFVDKQWRPTLRLR